MDMIQQTATEQERHRVFVTKQSLWEEYRRENPGLDLPTDFPTASQRSFSGAVTGLKLESRLTEGLCRLSASYGCSREAVYLAATMILLGKYSRQEELFLPTAWGKGKEALSLLPIYAEPRGEKGLPTFLKETEAQLTHLPSCEEAVGGELGKESFPVVFSVEEEQTEGCLFVRPPQTAPSFDLALRLREGEAQTLLLLEYATELYCEERAQRMLRHYVGILEQLLQDPEQRVATLMPITPREREQITGPFNATDHPKDTDRTVMEVFEQLVREQGERIAVVDSKESLSYGQLNARANRLAWTLKSHHIGPGDRVAILPRGGSSTLVGLCAIVKAGAAYVPMDPDYPQQRIRDMLEDCEAGAVLSCTSSIETDRPLISLEDIHTWDLRTEDPPRENTPEDIAYCIYTSGTTGKPKGVQVSHRSLLNLVLDCDCVPFSPQTNAVQTGQPVFDASVLEFWGTLLNGGCLHMISRELLPDPTALGSYLRQQHINTMFLTTALVNHFAGLDPSLFDGLSVLYFGGERVSEEHVRILHKRNPKLRLIDCYGPTEATVVSLRYEIPPGEEGRLPIGTPIHNVRAYIMQGNSLCGIGVPGELCIGGQGLSAGYLNRRELNEERFIPNPFGEGKLYRTGDLASWRSDGRVDFLGRMDRQIKLRGYRIELREIESTLRRCTAVRDGVITLGKTPGGEAVLQAYVVGQAQLSQVRREMEEALPAYMIPSAWMHLDALPLTRNGKVDHRALPPIPTEENTEYEAPETPTQTLLCHLFSEILGIGRVGRKDSFFALGGHSLKAAVLANRIEELLSCHLSMGEIFEGKTPLAIGEYIDKHLNGEEDPIPHGQEKDSYPLSPAQKRMYLVQQMDPCGISYNNPVFWAFRERPDPHRLQQALEALLSRHEILRTVFVMEKGRVVQRVLPKIPLPFRLSSWQGDWEDYAREQFVRPFSPEAGPLLRMELLENQGRWILMLDIHHLITDGLSFALFCKELRQLYEGTALPEQKLQYRDYSQWIRTRDQGEAEHYWKSLLQGAPASELPTDYSRPRKQSFQGARAEISVPKPFLQELRRLCKTEGITEYMAYLAGLMILLGKYTGQEDVVLGSAYSGRTHRDTEGLQGMFVSTLALRAEPTGEKTLRSFLEEIRKLAMDAYRYQDYPFEELVDGLGLSRTSGRNPIFDVMMAMEDPDSYDLSLGHVQGQKLPFHNGSVKFDLNFMIESGQESCVLALEYATALYAPETAQRILTHYLAILRQMTEGAEKKLSQILPLTEEEERKILHDFNQTDADYPTEATLVSLFREQARKTPDRIALTFRDRHLSYRELDHHSDLIAEALRQRGIGRGDLVPLFIERCPEMVIGLYGILKAGAAYVPINTSYPRDRVAFILEDCGGKLLLTGHRELPVETELPQLDLIDFDYQREPIATEETAPQPEDLCYIIYTSGTTGKPKGVMICHRNVVRLMSNSSFQFDFGQEDVWMMFHSYGFDFSVWEMYGSTLFGGRLVVVDEETARDSHSLKALMCREGVTVLNQVPSSFYRLQDCCDGREGLKLRYLIFGGEALRPDKLAPWHTMYPQCRIINMYGITETTVHVTYRGIGQEEIRAGISDIGSAIPTLKVYILRGDSLCGIGVPGELCVAGEGLAKGYLHRPDLTEEKFIPNPFGEGRLYRSGDLARWLPNGNLEYLGRIDDQVKIRGFRIELGEIESGLRRCEGIRDCAVILRKDAVGEAAIYAYVVADREPDFGLIRNNLRQSMPDYMIPAYMMQIPVIPVTGNGKLDRKALPEFTGSQERDYVAPKNPTEETLCELFCELLGMQRVSVRDSFFELGGHSLRGVELASRIRSAFGVEFAMKDVFLYPSPEQIAVYLQETRQALQDLPVAEEREYYPLSPAQKGVYFASLADETGIAYNMPYVFRLTGEVKEEALQEAFRELIRRHEILRTGFSLREGEPVQWVLSELSVEAELCEDPVGEEDAILQDFVRPFSLEQPPLIRGKLVRRKEDSLLLLDLHHIIFDGLSGNILFRELSELYEGKSLPKPQRQYRDYSTWIADRDLSEQKAFWLAQYAEEAPTLELPTDFPRPPQRSFRGALTQRHTEPALGQKLRKLAQAEGVTEYPLYLAAAMILVSKYGRQEDVVLGTVAGGRGHDRLRDMPGMFVSTLALRSQVEGKKTFRSFLRELGEYSAQALSHQEYSYGQLVEELALPSDPTRNPLFDVVFAMEHEGAGSLELQGLQCRAVLPKLTTAKFDLTLQVSPGTGGTKLLLEYATDLFRQDTAERLLRHYVSLLEQILRDPDQPIATLMPLTEEERAQIVGKFNGVAHGADTDRSLMEAFRQWVKEQPERTAVVFGEEKLSYRELNEKANRVAWTLRTLGVNRADRVAILPKRGSATVIGLCGILKAGAAYVPIDPDYPQQRIYDLLEDSDPKAVLTYGCAVDTDRPVLSLEDESLWDRRTEDIPLVNEPEDIANCIYTSGTTGKPKGVLVRHKGILNLVLDCDYMPFGRDTDTVQTGQLVFDASTFEIWGTLMNGGCLHMIPQELLLNAEAFRNYLKENRINMQFLTTALFNQFVGYDPTMFDGLQALCFGGERVSEEHVRLLQQRRPDLRLTNCYGPTESTVIALRYPIPTEKWESIPIGSPVHNTQIYILQGTSLCGIGVPGELCIAGEGLAAGYLNRPELTEEKFIPNPFGEGKLYRTGDLARLLPDGNVDFMGRIDQQVKIRGFRIEPTEVESVLRGCKGVRDCAVTVDKTPGGENALFAYVVGEASISEVKKELEAGLPAYMIPSYWMTLDSIPLTRNGKLDRKALPQIREEAPQAYTAPGDETEQLLAEAFQKVLGVERIGIYDNFFELGGHSLKCAQLVNLLRGQIGIKDVFEKKTVAALAELLRGCPLAREQGIEKQPDAPYYPMSEAQKRLYLFEELDDSKSSYHVTSCYSLEGSFDLSKAEEAFRSLASRHESLRTSFSLVGQDFRQTVHEKADYAMERIALGSRSIEEGLQSFLRPYDLSKPGLVRTALAENDRGQQ
ncbi:MAG: amino acid adenylation domain-containing protein, partial [Oscillospiraceae bacterium]|nr:amino acid adenylation domain-containing protein [Oscillospiraceae bacterium]